MRPYGPLRGRDEVLATALGVIRRTRVHGASGVVLITGDPGIGKTALLSEICRQATHTRIRVARSKCDEVEQACPGAPILGLLRTGRDPLLTATEFREITGLTGEPLVLVDRAAEHLERLAAGERILVALDDVHWADRLSRYALRSLIARLAGRSVVWVLASRSADAGLTVSAADTVGVEHIRLEPLPRAMIAEIARDRLGNSLNGRVDELLDAAGGNPLLATHIIDGVARCAETGRDEEIPAEFRTAVYQRLAGLSGTARDIVEVLAAAGRAVSLTELSGLYETTWGAGDDDAVASVTSSGLVLSTGAELNFGHDLVRQAVYELIPDKKRQRLHARLARHFAESAADPVLAAVHARAAAVGDEPNARILVAGAEALVTTSAVDAAEFALQAFRTLRPGQPQWLELGERVVSVLSSVQRANDTIAVADRLLATIDDVDAVSRVQIHLVKALWLSGRFPDLIDRAERGLASTTGRCDLAARSQAARALTATRTTGADAAAELADAALAQARATRDNDALALALQAAGEAAHAQRRHQLALKHFRELRSVTADSYLAEEIMQLQLLDRYDDAQMLLDAACEDSHAKAESLLPNLLFTQAKQHYNLGNLAQADQVAEAVVELGQMIGTTVHVVEATLIRAFVALLRGQAALAEQRLGLAADLTDDQPGGHPGVTFTQGWLTALRGDPDGSREILAQLLATPYQSRSYWAWWPCWMAVFFEVGMACSAPDFTERAVGIAEEAAERNPDVATLTGLALNMRGVCNHDLAMVAESVRVLQHSPRRVLRAIGAEAYGTMLLEAGQNEAALHQLDTAWDDYDLMGASARRAAVQRVMRQTGARRTKWVGDHDGSQPRPLTEAERRVAYLIADGHTDKSAAKALGISVNTVGTHLRSAYSKLGVQSRVQLTNALRERGELN
jgi:DNA-binding NarL/FixJ family response regulator